VAQALKALLVVAIVALAWRVTLDEAFA